MHITQLEHRRKYTTTEIVLDALCENSVTVLKITVFNDNGEMLRMPPHAKAYVNSAEGRQDIAKDLEEPYLTAVMQIWGDVPTILAEEV